MADTPTKGFDRRGLMLAHPGEGVFGMRTSEDDIASIMAECRIIDPINAAREAGWDMHTLISGVIRDLVARVEGLMQRRIRSNEDEWVQVYMVIEGLDQDEYRSVSTPHMQFASARQLTEAVFEVLEDALQSAGDDEDVMQVTERSTLLAISLDVLSDERRDRSSSRKKQRMRQE